MIVGNVKWVLDNCMTVPSNLQTSIAQVAVQNSQNNRLQLWRVDAARGKSRIIMAAAVILIMGFANVQQVKVIYSCEHLMNRDSIILDNLTEQNPNLKNRIVQLSSLPEQISNKDILLVDEADQVAID